MNQAEARDVVVPVDKPTSSEHGWMMKWLRISWHVRNEKTTHPTRSPFVGTKKIGNFGCFNNAIIVVTFQKFMEHSNGKVQ